MVVGYYFQRARWTVTSSASQSPGQGRDPGGCDGHGPCMFLITQRSIRVDHDYSGRLIAGTCRLRLTENLSVLIQVATYLNDLACYYKYHERNNHNTYTGTLVAVVQASRINHFRFPDLP